MEAYYSLRRALRDGSLTLCQGLHRRHEWIGVPAAMTAAHRLHVAAIDPGCTAARQRTLVCVLSPPLSPGHLHGADTDEAGAAASLWPGAEALVSALAPRAGKPSSPAGGERLRNEGLTAT